MGRPISAKVARKIEALGEQGQPQREIAKRIGVSLATVNKVLNRRPEPTIAPAGAPSALAAMAPADRLEAQLASLDQVLATPGLTPPIRARILTTYSNLLERAAKIRGRDSKGERQFDGLASLLLSATHADAARWSKAPADWLADVVPRHLPELHEIAGALERVPADTRQATGQRLRPVLHRILSLLDAP